MFKELIKTKTQVNKICSLNSTCINNLKRSMSDSLCNTCGKNIEIRMSWTFCLY